MLYFRAFKHGLAELPRASPAVRAAFRQRLERDGAATLHRELERIDPVAASRIHENDPQRLIRALEVFSLSGVPISSWWARAEAPPASVRYRLLEFALVPERARLHAVIEARFDEMLSHGLVDEVRALLARGLPGDLPAMRAVGYRQVIAHLEGRTSYAEMRRAAIAATRQLAKRQLTWLAQWRDATLLDPIRVAATDTILNSLGAARIVGRS
jgi:tRNA dimethylallyltransferase